MSLLEQLSQIMLGKCDDGSCCCIPLRKSLTVISGLNLIATILDKLTWVKCSRHNQVLVQVTSMKSLLTAVFQLANILLLLAAIFENALLIQLYVWYSLGFTVLCLIISIVEFAMKFKESGCLVFAEFLVDVIFLFVTFRCLPVVDMYRKQLDSQH